jgi:hypothetical protein
VSVPGTPANEQERMLGRAIDALAAQRRFPDAVRADVERELLIRTRTGLAHDEPSVSGTLRAATSWVLPAGFRDRAQHTGAGSYQNPWFPQLPRGSAEDDADAAPLDGYRGAAGAGGGAGANAPERRPWRMRTQEFAAHAAPSLGVASVTGETTVGGDASGAGGNGGHGRRWLSLGGVRRGTTGSLGVRTNGPDADPLSSANGAEARAGGGGRAMLSRGGGWRVLSGNGQSDGGLFDMDLQDG